MAFVIKKGNQILHKIDADNFRVVGNETGDPPIILFTKKDKEAIIGPSTPYIDWQEKGTFEVELQNQKEIKQYETEFALIEEQHDLNISIQEKEIRNKFRQKQKQQVAKIVAKINQEEREEIKKLKEKELQRDEEKLQERAKRREEILNRRQALRLKREMKTTNKIKDKNISETGKDGRK